MNTQVKRYWINQPSILQEHHNLHGVNVLGVSSQHKGSIRIYFLKGDLVSMEISKTCLSLDWV